jgi:hypothetical protein
MQLGSERGLRDSVNCRSTNIHVLNGGGQPVGYLKSATRVLDTALAHGTKDVPIPSRMSQRHLLKIAIGVRQQMAAFL